MHRLLIPEIVCLFCSELGSMGANRSLAMFAQTCLAFSEPALDALWYELHDLQPLVKCMPHDVWWLQSSNTRRKRLHLQRPVVPTDWERFVYHAGRVRIFIYNDDDDLGACDVFQTLSLGSTRQLLLPKLRELLWDVGEQNSRVFQYIRLFLGPHIKRLHLNVESVNGVSDKFIRLSLLHTLATQYPSLLHLNLLEDLELDPGVDFIDSISQAVCGWNQLRQLSVRRLSPNALHHVAVLPTLELVALTDVTEAILLPLRSRSSTVPFFPCIQRLEVTCDAGSFAIGLVEAISSSTFASIRIQSHYFGETACQDLINALRDYCSRSLKSIYISGEHRFIPTSIDVKPLFVFSDLTNVKLAGSGAQLELDDTSLTDMALAWPHITSLVLRGSSRVTLWGLLPLAQYCLKLRHLDIFFDPSSVPPQATELFSVKNEVLISLDVSHCPVVSIPEPERVAGFIHSVFPRAGLNYRVGTNWSEVAKEVAAVVEAFFQRDHRR